MCLIRSLAVAYGVKVACNRDSTVELLGLMSCVCVCLFFCLLRDGPIDHCRMKIEVQNWGPAMTLEKLINVIYFYRVALLKH